MALPTPEVGEPFVDAEDVADVVVAALTEDGHAGQVYEVTGPRLMRFADAVADIAAAGVYGTGLAQFVVAVPGRFGSPAFDRVSTFGRDLDVPAGEAALIGTGLLTVLVVRADRT
jgi:nucleoside-diphosphate-sugar epimerase